MGPKVVLRVIVATALAAIALVLGADVVAHGEAAGHVRYHALFALVVESLGLVLAWRGARAGYISAPALGLFTLAVTQLVEGVGGAGFDANNETRNGLAVIHDLGLALTPIGMVAAVVGIAIGVWTGARKLLPVPVAGVATGAIVVGGLVFVKTMIGF